MSSESYIFSFFFMILRLTPRSTLFPYTTLFRSVLDAAMRKWRQEEREPPRDVQTLLDLLTRRLDRSEEHTSELQSRENLVCRLLLEKKKKKVRRNGSAILDYVHGWLVLCA